MSSKTRLRELDVFRGLAAVYVIVYHYASYFMDFVSTNPQPLSRYFTGIYGVHLFFMISGFVIFLTLERTKHPVDFVVSRFSRLFPGYWVAVIIAFLSIRIFNYTEAGISVRRTIANFSMIQHWVGIEHVDGVYWTLSIELAFYFAMLFLFIFRALKYIEVVGAGWLILMLLYTTVGFKTTEFFDFSNHLKCGHLFFAGILFYKIKFYGATWYRYVLLAMCLFTQFMIKIGIHSGHTLDPIQGLIVISSFFLAFYLFINDKLSFISLRPLVFLGTISYSLYLIHQNVSCPIMRFLYSRDVPMFFVFFIPFVASVIVASAITFIVEQPAQKYIRDVYKDWKATGKLKLKSLKFF